MEEAKLYLYLVGAVFGITGSWFAVKHQTRNNVTEIGKLNDKIEAGFKKLDHTNSEISLLKAKASHFLTRVDVENSHPTKRELELHLEQLHKSDDNINEDIKSLKQEITHKLDKIMDILLAKSDK